MTVIQLGDLADVWWMEESLTSHTDSRILGDGVIAVVRLGDQHGTWHVPQEFTPARHVLLHTTKSRSNSISLRSVSGPLTPASREFQALVGH